MTKATDALAALGISADEAIQADEMLKEKTKINRDPRICLCGHASNKHLVANGVVMCNPSRMVCPCKNLRPVIEVEDTRKFLRKTTGPGIEHALVRGIAALAKEGKEARWIDTPKCDRCSTTDGKIVPVPITAGKTVAYEPTNHNALLCEKCLGEI
jgi:hypothetical protein